ncbi:hypothetical protein MXC99_07330 [Thauera aromatica]|uniref:hypothetical protein n=1 Tax=Thauera aromatica TaxID=59405 RepID=UPI001FFC8D1E|nr:hypothetical protein [Thauera aromatica]MCK2087988.1 hypothetical protein [Thauera aromatica]
MDAIRLDTAAALTGLSKRTLWRRLAGGALRAVDGAAGEATRVRLDEVLALSPLRLEAEARGMILDADRGAAPAQCELALLLLEHGWVTTALAWLEKAARQLDAEALYWLGRCSLAGTGIVADEAAGMEWLRQAARRGHVIAPQLMRHLQDPARPAQTSAELAAALDAIERAVVLQALRDTAAPA